MLSEISQACVFEREMAGVEEADDAPGISRLNASAPAGTKNESFLPHTARRDVVTWWQRE